MSILHLNQIKSRISSLFDGRIDMSDVRATGSELESQFLTRALAAYAIHHLARAEIDVSAASIVDGGDDNGLDAIHFDDAENRMYIIQSKWIHDGRGEPSNADVKKFAAGVRDLFNLSFERFNPKINAKKDRITGCLNDPKWTYSIVLAYTGINQLAEPSRRDLDDLANEMNDASELVTVIPLSQSELHSSLASSLAGAPINLEITLYSWGKVENPHKAFYGQVNASEVAQWWKQCGTQLFSRNLRNVLGDTEVNEEIRSTMGKEPERFWYFNNGITVVADSIKKTMAGGGDRDFGTFHCTNVSVVNGAQTVSTVGRNVSASPSSVDKIRIPLRLISLEGCAADFGSSVTRANNRQNRIENRDFVSQDRVQLTMKRDLAIDGIDYNLMRSETFVSSEKSFDLVESTTAMACASGRVSLVVQLKREISKLWENLERAPYRELFNDSVSASYVWRCVQIQRIIDKQVTWPLLTSSNSRIYGVTVHGNRLISMLAFSGIDPKLLTDPTTTFELGAIEKQIGKLTELASLVLVKAVEENYSNAILATLFKNASKCANLHKIAAPHMTIEPEPA
jgi:hypothetical protein